MGIMEEKVEKMYIYIYVYIYIYIYTGGCQNYGPFLDSYYNTAPDIQGTQKRTVILTTTHMLYDSGFGVSVALGARGPGGSSRVGSKSGDLTQSFVGVLSSKSLKEA